jgi:hypothetical protein
MGSRVAIVAAALASAACSSGERRFPLRDPMRVDTDLRPVSIDCRPEPTKKDAHHVACAPAVYVSPLAWDGIDNSIFRPLSELFAVQASEEAMNFNAFDEVPDSSWFENRIGARAMTDEELMRGGCMPDEMLRGEDAPDGSWVIDKGKDNGSSPGFRVKVPGKGKYMLKSDAPVPERPSAASVIGAAAYHAAGFNFSCEQVVYVKRSALKLLPGLTVTDNTEVSHPFDQARLDKLLDGTTKKGEYIRFQASAWLEGRLIGPFRYERTRDDDPNDVIPHQDRRELRGGRLLAAWLDHFDAREQNSMDMWVAANPKNGPDSSPGYVRHYYLDTSDTLGSTWDWDGISRRLGHSYVLDWGDIGLDFATLGFLSRPWDREHIEPGFEKFGYFSKNDFVPEGWVNEYPNPAFSRMTERDGAWMARILARFTPAFVHRLAEMGRFSDSRDTEYIAGVLESRLEAILARYLTKLSPMADVHVEPGDRLCGVNLAEMRGVRPASAFAYSARAFGQAVGVARGAAGNVCITLPHVAPDGGPADDAAERYVNVEIADGVARPLEAYLYDLGPKRGYRLVGLERPE